MTSTQQQEQRSNNVHVLKQIVRAILYLGKQGIPVRGDRESESMAGGTNPGNFLALLKEFAEKDLILKQHLDNLRMRNATYISPQTQNGIISIISNDIILPELKAEVTQCPFYSVLADEVTSHNTEHLAVCIRFVDGSLSLSEKSLWRSLSWSEYALQT